MNKNVLYINGFKPITFYILRRQKLKEIFYNYNVKIQFGYRISKFEMLGWSPIEMKSISEAGEHFRRFAFACGVNLSLELHVVPLAILPFELK